MEEGYTNMVQNARPEESVSVRLQPVPRKSASSRPVTLRISSSTEMTVADIRKREK